MKITFTEYLRKKTRKIIQPIAKLFHRLGISANMLTIAGFVGNVCAAAFISLGKFFWGGVIAAVMCPLDVLDGAVARLDDRSSSFGSMLDSVIDRYTEMVLFLGVMIYFLARINSAGIIVTFLAMSGAFLVSYVRARGEGLGLKIKAGLMTRVERMIVLVVSLLFSQPFYGLLLIAFFSHFTAVQRLFIGRKILKQKEK